MTTLRYAQLQNFTLYSAGSAIGDTTLTLTSFKDILGANLSMTSFGDIGYGTLEPGSSSSEEQISFTGITQNANGTATLTGVKTVLFIYPYTETSGISKSHAGGVKFVITNTSGFYNQIIQYINGIAIAGSPTATTTTLGISKLSTTPVSSSSPIVVGDNDVRVSQYTADTGSTNTYAIAPSPAITAYAAGQFFTFKSTHANTSDATLNVNSLGAKTMKKLGNSTDLIANDILNNQIVTVFYDGTVFQVLSVLGNTSVGYSTQTFTANGTWTKPSGAKYVTATVIGSGGSGGGAHSSNGKAGGGAGGGAINAGVLIADIVTSTVSVTVPASIAGGAAQTNGSDGSAASFGSYVSANGGAKGIGATASDGTGGAGGTATGSGIAGGAGANGGSGGFAGGGGGGAGGGSGSNASGATGGTAGTSMSSLGAGGAGGALNSNGTAGSKYGGGGGGGGYNGGTGGASAGGLCVVITYF